MSDKLVSVCKCADLVRAQAIRASLEARGIPTLIDGEHQRNVMGIFGTVVDLRIMVPRSRLRLAHALAKEIIPDLPPLDLDDDEPIFGGREDSPMRRPLPGELEPLEDELDDDEYDDEDDEDTEDATDLAEMREHNTLRWRRLIVGGWSAMAIMAVVFTGSVRALLSLGILAALVFLGVLPLRPGPKPE